MRSLRDTELCALAALGARSATARNGVRPTSLLRPRSGPCFARRWVAVTAMSRGGDHQNVGARAPAVPGGVTESFQFDCGQRGIRELSLEVFPDLFGVV